MGPHWPVLCFLIDSTHIAFDGLPKVLADAHILALRTLDGGSRTYNLGSGSGYSVKRVVDLAELVPGREIGAIFGPRRAGDPAVLVAGGERIKRE